MIRRQLEKYWPAVPVLLLLLLALWSLAAPAPYLPFFKRLIAGKQAEIAAVAAEIRRMAADNQRMANDLSSLSTTRDFSMKLEEQAAAVTFRERIETAAGAAGLRSRAVGGIRKVEISDQIQLFEISFSADGQTDELVRFLDALYRERPRVYWKSINIKPDNLTKPEFLSVSGTLCAVNFLPGGEEDGIDPEIPPDDAPDTPEAPSEPPPVAEPEPAATGGAA